MKKISVMGGLILANGVFFGPQPCGADNKIFLQIPELGTASTSLPLTFFSHGMAQPEPASPGSGKKKEKTKKGETADESSEGDPGTVVEAEETPAPDRAGQIDKMKNRPAKQEDFQLLRKIDKYSSTLSTWASSGKVLDAMTIAIFEEDNKTMTPKLSYHLRGVLITSYSVSGSSGGDTKENILLRFKSMELVPAK